MLKGPTQRTGKFTLKAAVLAVFLVAALSAGSCSFKDNSAKEKPITVGMEATAVNSLIYIAEDRKFFAANGIKMIIRNSYPSGAAATERMLEGETDVSTTAEFAIARNAFARKAARTLGSIDMFMHMKLIGRKDRGIKEISDLVGKRIGVPIKTAADFKLGRFLDLHGIDKSEITIIDVQAPQSVYSLTQGNVDALVAWQPNVMAIQDRLGDNVVIWDVQSGQPMYCLLVTAEKWAGEHPDLLKLFMKSLLQAENYLIENGEQARAIVQKRLGYNDSYLRTIWPEHQFSLRLDQSLILALEDQARWMIENRLTTEKDVPNVLEYLDENSLRAVKPQAVSIIR
jgi:NitT/TauT family transport system substrate-binding protein